MTEEQHRSKKRLTKEVSSTTSSKTSKINSSSNSKPSSSYLDKMKVRLSGGFFRMINEKLYTCRGDEALGYFKDNPSLFNVFHNNFRVRSPSASEKSCNLALASTLDSREGTPEMVNAGIESNNQWRREFNCLLAAGGAHKATNVTQERLDLRHIGLDLYH